MATVWTCWVDVASLKLNLIHEVFCARRYDWWETFRTILMDVVVGGHRISTRGVHTEKYPVPIFTQHKILLICHNKTFIQLSPLFKGQFLIHVPTPMCFYIFTSEKWICQTAFIIETIHYSNIFLLQLTRKASSKMFL